MSFVSNVVSSIFGGGPSAPPAPDYTGAAKETAQGNLEAARAAAAANRVNQVTPYGSLSYTQSGKDPFGNPLYTATQTLSPEQQELYNYDVATSKGLGQLSQTGLNYVQNMMQSPFSTSNLPTLASTLRQPNLQTTLENQGMEGWDRATNLIMQRLQPQMQRQQQQLDQQLANQGIPIGSEAYTRAKQDLAMQQNDLMNQAALGGAQLQNQFFGQGLQSGQFANTAQQQMLANQLSQANLSNLARQQGFQEQAYMRNEPLNTLNAVRSGAQVTGPSFVNVPQQVTTAGPDLLGAAGLTGQYNLGQYNAQQAGQNAMTGGLFNLAGAALMSPKGTFTGPTGMFSDPRLKENIKAIGVMENGLTLYSFEYKDEVKNHPLGGQGVHVGVMADEVEQVFPYAVSTLDDGYKVVNYGLLP